MTRIALAIDGMSCSHCLSAVRKAIEGIDGAELEELTLGSAKVKLDPSKARPEQVMEAVEEAGYQAQIRA
jgi:copper chaperone